jgi:hypothetical protein
VAAQQGWCVRGREREKEGGREREKRGEEERVGRRE